MKNCITSGRSFYADLQMTQLITRRLEMTPEVLNSSGSIYHISFCLVAADCYAWHPTTF